MAADMEVMRQGQANAIHVPSVASERVTSPLRSNRCEKKSMCTFQRSCSNAELINRPPLRQLSHTQSLRVCWPPFHALGCHLLGVDAVGE